MSYISFSSKFSESDFINHFYKVLIYRNIYLSGMSFKKWAVDNLVHIEVLFTDVTTERIEYTNGA